MRKLVSLVLIFAAAAAAALWIGDRTATRVEATVSASLAAALEAGGHGWARFAINGERAIIEGQAPNEAARVGALAAARGVAPDAVLIDRTTAAPPPPRFRPEIDVTLMRGLGDLTVSGALPGPEALELIFDRFAADAPRLTRSNFSRTDAYPPEVAGWMDAAAAAAEIAAAMLHGRVLLGDGEIGVYGLAASEADAASIADSVAALSAAGWRATSDVAAPPGVTEEFLFHAEAVDGALTVRSCAAADAEGARGLAVAAREIADIDLPACRIGAGAPDGGWIDASEAALAALVRIPSGEMRLLGRRARLTARPPTRARELSEARQTLAAALPAGYRVAVLAEPNEGSGATSSASAPVVGALSISWRDGALTLEGDAPSDLLGDAAAAYARAARPGATVKTKLDIDASVAAGAWRIEAMALIDAIGFTTTASARVEADAVVFEGDAKSAAAVRATHDLLEDRLGDARRIITRLRVSPAVAAADQPLPAAACAGRLAETATADPVTFEPGSSRIADASAPVIETLAGIIARCDGARIEIGGHTDSQGSARTNMGLSRARAEAVMAALLEAGASARVLSAKGYGEDDPIADNATAAGRTRNRRIEFIVERTAP